MYKSVHPEISKSEIHSFNLHLWYLTPEMVPLALSSNKVPAEARRVVANSLLATKPDVDLSTPQNRFGKGFGKPRFPINITLSTTC
jgi:hypothetical protein